MYKVEVMKQGDNVMGSPFEIQVGDLQLCSPTKVSVCLYVCVPVFLCTCMFVWVHVSVAVCLCGYMSPGLYVCVVACFCGCMSLWLHVRVLLDACGSLVGCRREWMHSFCWMSV